MPKLLHCSKCQEEHSCPVGKKCMKSAGESFSSAAQVPAPPSASTTNEITVSDLEDVSDFSWESPKACHAVVLTNMEADRLNWADTDKINCIRRAHAQRHTSGAQTSASCYTIKKNKTSYSKNGVICRYFQEGTCKYPTHHKIADLANSIDMSVKIGKVHMLQKIVIRKM